MSDTEEQPLIIGSHLGDYAIVTVGRIDNVNEIVESAFEKSNTYFSETTGDGFDPTESTASIIDTAGSSVRGSQRVDIHRVSSISVRGKCTYGPHARR